MRQKIIAQLVRFLRERYNKEIIEIKDPFRDMKVLLSGIRVNSVCDIGAHHGEISLKFAELFPSAKIYSFEPYSQSFQILRQKGEKNSNIIPINCAISSSIGEQKLYVNAQDSTNALSPTDEMGKKYQSWQTETLSTEIVQVLTLDSWGKEKLIPEIELLKLDVQGFELNALQGAQDYLKSSVRLIYTEIEFVKIYKENCLYFELENFLREYNFELFQLYNLTSGDDGQLITGDAIFIRRDRVAL
jgi:FkbM family methyltransferase